MTGAARNFFCAVIIDADESWPANFAVIADGTFLFDEPKSVRFEPPHQLAEFHAYKLALNTVSLRQQLFDHFRALDAAEPLVEPLELHREPLVIDPQAVQDRGIEI